MIKINLIAETPSAGKAKGKRPSEAAAAGVGGPRHKGDIILLAVLLLGAAVVGGQFYRLNTHKNQLKRVEAQKRVERDELQVYIKKVEELEKTRADLKHKVEVINNLKNNQQGPVRIMDEVSKALPELVWLEQMVLAGNNLSLAGKAMDENAVANYISNLDASLYFQEPVLSEMVRVDKDTFNFKLTCVFNPKPEEIPSAAGAAAAVSGQGAVG